MSIDQTTNSSSSSKRPVIIVGAGPVGLMAALVLVEAGVPVVIYERNLRPTTEWRAAALHARSLEMLARHNLAEKLIHAGNPFTGFTFIKNGRSQPGLTIDMIRSEFPFTLGCGQDTTERILNEQLAAHSVHVQWGWEYVSHDSIDDGISVHLKRVDTDETIVREAAYLVGCDGAHSKVRKAIGSQFIGKRIDYRIAVCDMEIDEDWLSTASFIQHREGMLGAIRAHPGNQYRLFTTWGADAPELTKETLVETIKRRVHPHKLHEPRVLSCSAFTVNERRASRYMSDDGRVFICGDAAHVHSPAGGQGMNTGMQDAENLAWKMAMVYHGFSRPELLASYETERTVIADDVLKLSGSLLSLLTSPMKQMIVGWLLPLIKRMPLFITRTQSETTSQLCIAYPIAKHCSSFADSPAWSRATASWLPFGWFADRTCAPGTRAVDCQVVDAARRACTRMRTFYAANNSAFKGILFIDYGKTEPCKDATTNGDDGAGMRRLSADVIEQIDATLEAFRAYKLPVMPAFVVHGVSMDSAETVEVPACASGIIGQLHNRFADVPVFVDMNQGQRYDHRTMADIYQCSRVKQRQQHAVYIIRPDAYVAMRMLLSEAATTVRVHLDTICLKQSAV
ncbi:FAD binding domain-containing protein [Syncephalis pseudoplumigaleata]|uniref:FAD binding domain-containing protein n=1 Tax=Syncephalis pseudoplumigaleata TaxID=1712513 RepID=A0A4P9Z5L0_9FUNG|nr:FAD binding domain-containing protein [Syncephalis pseudoplumigaleata]|eukprot:RKP27748.1 FAD binding domain-containing protein [Syncephalis pseudoplumigaleata]